MTTAPPTTPKPPITPAPPAPATPAPPAPVTPARPAPSTNAPIPSPAPPVVPAPSKPAPPAATSPAPEANPAPPAKTGPGDWKPTEHPNETIVPGKMRSDREKIPDGFTKADADKAETMEARIEKQRMLRVAPGCQVYWPAPYEVCGAIRDKYNELGGPNGFLLHPKTNELTNPDGAGKRTEFVNGPIYWSSQGGAHPVVNHFLAAWARHGYEAGYIGYPTTDEIVNPDKIGRRQHFTGSTIYWKLNEAYSIGGRIFDKWGETGWEQGFLGYPTSDETGTPDGVGRFNRFERGMMYWTFPTDAHPVAGGILDKWAKTNWEQGPYGYPTSDERPRGSARDQDFQRGRIGWPTTAANIADIDWQEDSIDDGNCPGCGDDDRVRVTGPGWTNVEQPPRALAPRTPQSSTAVTIDDLPDCNQLAANADGATPYVWCREPESLAPRGPAPGWEFTSALDMPFCKEASTPKSQWIGDRQYQCMWRDYEIGLFDRKTKARIGTINAVQENQLRTKWNSTTWDARVAMHITKTTGGLEEASYAGSVWCNSDNGGSCNHTFDNNEPPKPLVVGDFIKDYKITGAVSPASVLKTTGFAQFTFTHPASNPVTTATAIAPTVRCDNIGDRNSQGCIVYGAEPIFDLRTRNVPTLADHVRKAQQSGLPGAPNGTPLTRTRNNQQNNRNATCNKIPGPRPQGMQCDEYPFASTNEGGSGGGPARTYSDCDVGNGVQVLDPTRPANIGAGGISMCMIPGKDNSRGGGITGWFLAKQRLLDGDKFYVRGS
ncbi:hypothetical protein [Nocardia sp. NPDC051570]|uniref:NucA/NucB deoxyribonuclease domain-containing protein n=1 Tax=Nocardia sp. NPDC051570 TaxID=3364324 RepID=UPI0037B38A27